MFSGAGVLHCACLGRCLPYPTDVSPGSPKQEKLFWGGLGVALGCLLGHFGTMVFRLTPGPIARALTWVALTSLVVLPSLLTGKLMRSCPQASCVRSCPRVSWAVIVGTARQLIRDGLSSGLLLGHFGPRLWALHPVTIFARLLGLLNWA